jgi:N-acetylmuramic acid 6-phosphate (MurNAc-6-P) etherase
MRKERSGSILVTCNKADTSVPISSSLPCGPEAIVGSTRKKAGTATKMV